MSRGSRVLGFWAGALVAGALLVGTACATGVSQTDYDNAVAELKTAQARVAELPGPHLTLAAKTVKPKRLAAAVQIDMAEMYFGTPEGGRNPTFRLPVGKTVGIHLHNEGSILHEVMIGRRLMAGGHGYEEMLTEKVPVDLFFYYGKVKAEVEGASFEELEVEPGVRDVWLRLTVPPELKGEWEVACFVEGHYEAGMHTVLVFE